MHYNDASHQENLVDRVKTKNLNLWICLGTVDAPIPRINRGLSPIVYCPLKFPIHGFVPPIVEAVDGRIHTASQ